MNIGMRINKITADSGLNKSEFCRKIGIDYSYLFYIMQGKRNPSKKIINTICEKIKIQDGVKINPQWLTSGNGEPYLICKEKIIRDGVDSLNINDYLKNKLTLDLSVLDDDDIVAVIEKCYEL